MPGAENRLSHYKNKGKSGEELRKKRTEVSVELRKKGRDDQLLKRRNIALDEDADDGNEINANIAGYPNGAPGKTHQPLPSLEEIVQGSTRSRFREREVLDYICGVICGCSAILSDFSHCLSS